MKIEILLGAAIIVIAIIAEPAQKEWTAPDISTIPGNEKGELIKYGRELIIHTSHYLGPKGTVANISNGMNCQNCHLQAGTKPWGNNYSGVASTYPKFRDRSGTIESIEKKINDCLERSLNGAALDNNSREMRAMVAYIKWLGKNVDKGIKPRGSGINNLKYLARAADTLKGEIVFAGKCTRCHGVDGMGQLNAHGTEYIYPPLWGPHSYNIGAGIYRISKLAGFVKVNMPFEENSHGKPVFTDEECWDVAAFINSQPRPGKDISKDWPDISKKPVDHPFGPYADTLSEVQHKYGPYR